MRGSFKGKSLISLIKSSKDALRHTCGNQVLSKGHRLTIETDSQGEEGNFECSFIIIHEFIIIKCKL